jgi:hypothetical protein
MGLHGGPGAEFAAPAAVAGGALSHLGDGQVQVSWEAGTAPDIDHYLVYCDTAAVFVPSAAKVVAVVDHPSSSVVDTPVFPICYYLVAAVDTAGYSGGYSARLPVEGSGPSPVEDRRLPAVTAIAAIAPNPFNPRTIVTCELPRNGHVELAVYDLRGRLVRSLVSGPEQAGSFTAVWDGRDRRGGMAAAGVYFLRLAAGGQIRTAKMVLAK